MSVVQPTCITTSIVFFVEIFNSQIRHRPTHGQCVAVYTVLKIREVVTTIVATTILPFIKLLFVWQCGLVRRLTNSAADEVDIAVIWCVTAAAEAGAG